MLADAVISNFETNAEKNNTIRLITEFNTGISSSFAKQPKLAESNSIMSRKTF